MNKYNKVPKNLGIVQCTVEEYFSYLYLPIKIPGGIEPKFEERLSPFSLIIGKVCCDYIGDFGLNDYISSYVYIIAKNQYQRNGSGFNRPGWHSDGFGTGDISYIWSNNQPTIFNKGPFELSNDDYLSMIEMEQQVKEENNYSFPNNSLLRMDQFTIHKVADYKEGNRAFVKICVSKDKYNLRGNSINYLLNDKWDYVDRLPTRNVPQNKG